MEASPEMMLLRAATNYYFQIGNPYDPEDPGALLPHVEGLMPSFATEERQRQLAALAFDTRARYIRWLFSGTSSDLYMEKREKTASDLERKAKEFLTSGGEQLTLPTQVDIERMVEEVVDFRFGPASQTPNPIPPSIPSA